MGALFCSKSFAGQARPLGPPEYALFRLRRNFGIGKRVQNRDRNVKPGFQHAQEEIEEMVSPKEIFWSGLIQLGARSNLKNPGFFSTHDLLITVFEFRAC